MFHQSPLSLWDFTIATTGEEPEPGEGAAFMHDCGVARIAVHTPTFEVTHNPTCPPRHVGRWYAVVVEWLTPRWPRVAHAG